MDKPRILDVGCGSGIPTMELARLADGEIIGIDIDQELLDDLRRKIKKAGVVDRVEAIRCSMSDMQFPEESFDIIWSEGSIYVIGFERGLQEWQRFLKPGGFMVIHDDEGNVEDKLKQISHYGYELVGHFILSKEIWSTEYYAPLEEFIEQAKLKYADNLKVLKLIRDTQQEIDMFKKNPKGNSSVIFVVKKR